MLNILAFDVGIKNLSFCLMNKEEILIWKVVELQEKSCRKGLSWSEILKKLHFWLNLTTTEFRVDKVLVEQQMTAGMKMVGSAILMFFVSKDIPAEFVSATKKLKNFPVKKGKKFYNERKKLAVCLTRFYLLEEKYYTNMEMFNGSKKKDDLADCFLYCKNHLLD